MDTVGGLQAKDVQQSRRPYALALRTGDSGDPPRGSDTWQNVGGVDPSGRAQEEEFAPLQGEKTCSTEDLHPDRQSFRELRPLGGPDTEEPNRNWRDFASRGVSSQSSGGNLNDLWQRFNERRSQREAGPPETPLLDRLERLSRLIHSSRNATPLGGREASAPGKRREERRRRHGEKEEKRRGDDDQGRGQREADRRRGNGDRAVREAWAEPEAEQEEESLSSSTLTESSVGRHRCPAERDGETDASDTASTMSTIDTARLIRAFGPGRVQANPGLNRLYCAIGRQKEGTEQRRGRKRAGSKPPAPAPSETNSTDDSTISTVNA